MFFGALALALAALPQSRAGTTFELVDLSPCRKAGAFADAVWKDALREKEDFTFHGVPFKLMKPENTADPSFALDLKPEKAARSSAYGGCLRLISSCRMTCRRTAAIEREPIG
jgi:hypothetical protein